MPSENTIEPQEYIGQPAILSQMARLNVWLISASPKILDLCGNDGTPTSKANAAPMVAQSRKPRFSWQCFLRNNKLLVTIPSLSLQLSSLRLSPVGREYLKSKMKYTCIGSVRGSCGINHRSFETAKQCCQRDHDSVRRVYPSAFPTRAYSDRHVVALDDEAERDLIVRCNLGEA